jgi:drug/metabolite transporter (DMT)-like permease
VADHLRDGARRPRLSHRTAPAPRRTRVAGAGRAPRPPMPMTRILMLLVTVALIVFLAAATISDIVHHGLSWLDVVALLVIVLFATGICGALWESIRRG